MLQVQKKRHQDGLSESGNYKSHFSLRAQGRRKSLWEALEYYLLALSVSPVIEADPSQDKNC